MANRMFQGIAAAAVGVLLFSGCSPAKDDSASAIQRESFPGIYAQEIEWGACGADFGLSSDMEERLTDRGLDTSTLECAMVEAPLDWNDPKNHETIELATMLIPATGEKTATLFSNPGGPGGSDLSLALGLAASPDTAAVRENYDFLAMDPRGIGYSSPVECEDVTNVREVQITLCAEEEPLVHSMGTSQVARDMDLLRVLQGEDQMDYLGYSYGTILGATYATLFPEQVGRMVLDSAPDATWASPVGDFDQAVAINGQIETMLAACEELTDGGPCPVTSEDGLIETVEKFNEAPLLTSDGDEVDGWLLRGYLTASVYGGDVRRAETLDTFGRALQGDQEEIDDLFATATSGNVSVSPGGMMVRCHSLPENPDIQALLDRMDEVGVPKALGGPDINEDTLAELADVSCAALPEAGHEIEKFSAPADQTMLVIGVTGDPATPFHNGRELARSMGNTRFLTLEGHGHGASYSKQSSCVDDATTAFLLEGTLPAEGTVCQSN